MKKYVSLLLMIVLLITYTVSAAPNVYASSKNGESRAIAIVFDNSGSMYESGNQAWCRATYAMEVFASMLNKGDVLQIYPMWPITIGGQTYTMQTPFQITDASQASTIRDIFTANAGGTPIESIDCAASGLQLVQADKKYMIVLTDGGTFSKNGYGLSVDRTRRELDNRIGQYASPEMTVMYLGIGSAACMPDTPQNEFFTKKQAIDTTDVLSTLTVMCNQIFGRDTLPKGHVSGNTMDFDISMSKLIVFVQGEDISNLKIVGESSGQLVSTQQTQYSTQGAGDYPSIPDTSLQGMMVTYADCASGEYDISYTGTATSVEVYYEPDADLDFVFTDAEGNTVDLNLLYEGDYKVSFGMKDAKTGQLISSDLLGNPHYEGSYSINGEETSVIYDGQSGEIPIALKMNDMFEAELTVTYLSGYTISKDSSDFGWPEGGVKVVAPPLGAFKVELTVPQSYILIKDLDTSPEIVASLTLDGKPLTAEEFAAVNVAVNYEGTPYNVTADAEKSQYRIALQSDPRIAEGDYCFRFDAQYADEAGREAQDSAESTVTLSHTPLWVKWVFWILIILLLAIITWLILHMKKLPKYMHTTRKLSSMNFDGDDVTQSTNFLAEIKKKSAKVQSQYGGKKFGIAMDVVAGKESYLYKSQKRRTAEVKAASVKKFGSAKIQEAMIGSVKYVADETTGKLVPFLANQKAFMLTNGVMVKYSGTIQDAGVDKDFEVTSKLNFKKK